MAAIAPPDNPALFSYHTTQVTAYIAQRDARDGNPISYAIENARLVLIAIENAKNFLKDCPQDQQFRIAAKTAEFTEMLACLSCKDYRLLNLGPRTRLSIDTNSSKGWFPKLYGLVEQFFVPTPGSTIKFYGKFKYADPYYKGKYKPRLIIGCKAFDPIETTEWTLTFQPNLTEWPELPFKPNKCSQFFVTLVVPFEMGMLISAPQTFEYRVPIRALPINVGTLDRIAATKEGVNFFHTLTWGEPVTFELKSERFSKITFKTFDNITHEFSVADFEAKALLPHLNYVTATYLRISQVAATGNDRFKWKFEPIAPQGLS